MHTTTAGFTKEVPYDATTRDFCALVNGHMVHAEGLGGASSIVAHLTKARTTGRNKAREVVLAKLEEEQAKRQEAKRAASRCNPQPRAHRTASIT